METAAVTAAQTAIDEGTIRVRFRRGTEPISARALLELLQSDDPSTADLLTALVRDASFSALYLEFPPLTLATVDLPAECVLVRSRSLEAAAADSHPFEEHLAHAAGDAVVFDNLGRDAVLVVPVPRQPDRAPYTHLAAFVRGCSAKQARCLWQSAAGAAAQRIGTTPLWVSTSGNGVPWLHVRLDSRPKYYQHVPYKTQPPARDVCAPS